ncbi:hypothetical protein [Kineothrix sp. MB12-C1]|uniref:hypothetical protein n=1 Tax=Kineothrix sp. MB12-C1 TaxID=3070215 RepID=UPI0027D2E90E|nr:hypothetical protein [Kineothrix sp. MB12-C1]WMC93362.1 hypothetical protein RBB56_03505 [Kineothrix sp. MB12-C1]
MIGIKPVEEDSYQKIIEWNEGKGEDYLYQWAGHKVYYYPISVEQVKMRVNEKELRKVN